MEGEKPIGIFDSGVGGLSVLLEIKKVLPKENFIFIADQANIPYGSKARKQLGTICKNITAFLVKNKIKLLIIACNTATCYALDDLRNTFSIPVIGVVPAIKPAVKKSKKAKIAVMSTPATSRSAYLKRLIKDYAKEATVLRVSCPGLENSIENLNERQIKNLLPVYSKKITNFGADVLVLGCTHYPIIKKTITEFLGNGITVIDSGRAIAKRARFILEKEEILSEKKLSEKFYTTGDPIIFSKIASKILDYRVKAEKIYV